jgi:glyoxylase-like metal-dependent hydrolase (beta-lactamase superfamily II)
MFYRPARQYLLPLKDRFDLVKANHAVLPGIIILPAYGHTPGNAMVDISSQGKRLLCIGDIIHSQQEFTKPRHCAAFDVDPEEAVKTRTRILTKAAKDGTFVFACHFTFPGLGYIRNKNGKLSWDAIRI